MLGSELVRRDGNTSAALRPTWRSPSALLAAFLLLSMMLIVGLTTKPASAAPEPTFVNKAPDGAGFTITPGDLKFILKQIRISEEHVRTLTPDNPCGSLVGPGDLQIPERRTPWGLRTVDGSCNNLFPGQERFASADEPFPRLTTPRFKAAEGAAANALGTGSPAVPSSSYAQKKGIVIDSRPRVVSNLIVDQTSTNPAAVAAAKFPVRTQGNEGIDACTTDPVLNPDGTEASPGVPEGCTPSHKTLFIPNVTTDVGLSPPYNSVFTFFGQFFDHGVDQTVKSGGTVFVPLKDDDPLITLGPDGKPNTGDEVPEGQRFMVLTRAQNQPGPDGVLGDRQPTNAGAPVTCTSLNVPAGCDESADDIQNANNTDSPWVDQSQTYTSHSSHQAFLREYVLNAGPDNIAGNTDDRPVDTGSLLGGMAGNGATGMATWESTKKQAAELLGLKLEDKDVLNVPMLAADPYGNFIPGPNGLPQYVTTSNTLIEGDRANPVPVPSNARYFDTPFLTDIAHNADPSPQDTDHNPGTPPVAPTPDADNTASADFANQTPGTYDDEMLNAHFIAGDGRVNENIALSSIHQVFHSEHDRLVTYIKGVLQDDVNSRVVGSDARLAAEARLAQWQLPTAQSPDGWNGKRLFQAARLVTEMEYQHLVFEDFARKVQPALKPFFGYDPDVNAAIPAEFAHAVYRFGHSMLDDDVARVDETATGGVKHENNVTLLNGFLNPPEYFHTKNSATPYTPEQAAGSIFLGSSDQIGNELDEFVTETLRNNLLGLPLDLPTINMTRAREAGVPPLNDLRRQLYDAEQDSQVAPYTSWVDYGEHLKHAESLANFVAAYGKHPSILSASCTTTPGVPATGCTSLDAKRAAAQAILDESADPAANGPADSVEFMNSTGAWANNANDTSTTGLDDVDLWVGGLAEITNINGGLLGTTFNRVFEKTLENLQDGDRLYYLNRTPGLNLRAQLEGNSFTELIQRNTDGTHTLKADAFGSADCRFELRNLNGTAAAFTASGAKVADDPNSGCREDLLLLRKPDGTIQYRQFNTVDPSGINGQGVYNGTEDADPATVAVEGDRVTGGLDNDTFWGGAGPDRIEGNPGDDIALGGPGRDTITDNGGDDILKGGAGNDSIDAGPGIDITMGGDGRDFISGGQGEANEHFGGEGDDFILAGAGTEDAIFGDGGDDWMQGGPGSDLLQGDHGDFFFLDPGEFEPGNDVMVGQTNDNDYDTEGGDDIMADSTSIEKYVGSGGFDWAIHQYTGGAADDDMRLNAILDLAQPVVVNRDRWQETEASSGSRFNDTIKGDDLVPATLGGAGFTGCDVLDEAGVRRIQGLNQILPIAQLTTPLQPVIDASAAGECPLSGPVWGEGNILIGGGGSDTIQGRGGDDIIDGDRQLTVRISVRNPADRTQEIGSTDLMEKQYLRNPVTGALTGPTLMAAVAAGTVNPADLVVTRAITRGTEPGSDTAVFAARRADYDVQFTANGRTIVTQTGPLAVDQKVTDGTDTLRNVERLRFLGSAGTAAEFLMVAVPNAPQNVAATAGNTTANVTWTAPAACGCPAISGYEIEVTENNNPIPVQTIAVGAAARAANVTGLTNGASYKFQVRAVNPVGDGPLSAFSNVVIPAGPPAAPTGVTAARGNTQVTVNWAAPNDNGSAITRYEVQARQGNVQVGALVVPTNPTDTSAVVTGLTNGTTYNFRVRAVNALGTGPFSAAVNQTPATTPGAPAMLNSTPGAAGGALTASANWNPPANTGGSAITNYRITPLLMAADGTTVAQRRNDLAFTGGAALRTRAFTLPAGNYRFEVVAINAVGDGVPGISPNLVSPA